MIFREELAQAILRGEKTATRRQMSDNPRGHWYREKCIYDVGQVFTINPGRGVANIGKARVTAVYKQRLGLARAMDARREGFPSLRAFRDAFARINGSFNLGEQVWVVEFELVPQPSKGGEG